DAGGFRGDEPTRTEALMSLAHRFSTSLAAAAAIGCVAAAGCGQTLANRGGCPSDSVEAPARSTSGVWDFGSAVEVLRVSADGFQIYRWEGGADGAPPW